MDGLVANTEKTKYVLLSRNQIAEQNDDIKIVDRSFENFAQFKYMEATVASEHMIQEEIKRRLNSNNACHHSVQNQLSSRVLSKIVKIRIYKSIHLPVNVFENKVRRIFGLKKDEMTSGRKKLHYEELRNLYSPSIIRK
jgi:hypothetical protein